jgi:glycosyltransferase involved in cell wall biosynthesis
MQELARIEDLQDRLGIEGKRIILYIGSMSLASHPVDLLVTAFRIVHSKYPGSLLLIVGGGEDLDSLQDLVHRLELQDDVIFTGRINPEQVVMYYHLGDVSVDPVNDDDQAKSRSPLKLFESWAVGVPFVTAAVGDRTALLGSPQAGVLANPGDPESLASAILSILNNPEKAKNLSRLGLERVGEYDWYRLAEKLDQTYPK